LNFPASAFPGLSADFRIGPHAEVLLRVVDQVFEMFLVDAEHDA
jgi:hypothetical protein